MDAPDNLEALLAEAAELLDERQTAEAEDLYRRILELDPENVTALNKLGVCRARQEDPDGAEEMFSMVLENDPKNVAALSNLGNIRYTQKRYDEAITLYKQAIALDPDYGVAHNNLAAAYKKSGNIGEFIASMKRAQRLQINAPPEPRTRSRTAGDGGRRGWGCLGRASTGILIVLGAALLLALT